MKKRHYRRKRIYINFEKIYSGFTYLCLLILASWAYKEMFVGLTFPKAMYSYFDEANGGYSLHEWMYSFVEPAYGYYKNKEWMEKVGLYDFDTGGLYAGLLEESEKAAYTNSEQINATEDDINNSYVNKEMISDNSLLCTGDRKTEEKDCDYIEGSKDANTDTDKSDDSTKEQECNEITNTFSKQENAVVNLDMEKLKDFSYLKQHFYTVDRTTNATEQILDIEKFLSFDGRLSQDNSLPQILIYHTHSQEGFLDSEPGNSNTTIVGVGEKLAEVLRTEYGYNVIHDTGEYDVKNRDYAYSVSAPAIEKILEENPSIEVIIDLHRDGVANETKLVKEVSGRTSAQFMFFNGISYLNATGPIEYLQNPYIDDNLAFSFQLKAAADTYYPGLCRNIYLKGLRYNMHYRPKSLLIEVGAQTNTLAEAMNAVDPIAHILSIVLNGENR